MSERLTDNPMLFRLRVRYGKRDRLKYLGHLELIHTIERIAYGCVLPHGQIKTGRAGPPARPATVATIKQPMQFTQLKRQQSEPRCFVNVTLLH